MASDARVRIIGQDQTKGAFNSVQKSIKSTESTVAKFGTTLAGVFGGRAVISAIQGVLTLGDEISDLSVRLGVSTQALTEYQFATAKTGVQFSAFTTALQRQTRRLAEAASGTGVAVDALEAMNLELRDVIGLPADKVFELFADRIDGMGDQALKTKTAFQLWDTECVKLLQTVQGGSVALAEYREQARATGNSLGGEQVAQLKAAAQAFQDLQLQAQGVLNTLVIQLAPGLQFLGKVVTSLLNPVLALGKAYGGLIAAIFSAAQGEFSQAGRILDAVWTDVSTTFSNLGGEVSKAFEELNNGSEQVKANLASLDAAAAGVANTFAQAAVPETRNFKEEFDKLVEKFKIGKNSQRELNLEVREFGTVTLPQTNAQVRKLAAGYDQLSAASNRAAAAQDTQGVEAANQNRTGLTAPSQGTWIFGIGSNRVLMNGLRVVRSLAPGEGFPVGGTEPTGSFATGTSAVPRDMTAKLEAGERVTSNNTTVNISFTGVPTDPIQMGEWVRSMVIPEINRAVARSI